MRERGGEREREIEREIEREKARVRAKARARSRASERELREKETANKKEKVQAIIFLNRLGHNENSANYT